MYRLTGYGGPCDDRDLDSLALISGWIEHPLGQQARQQCRQAQGCVTQQIAGPYTPYDPTHELQPNRPN
jgi:hypothetical protein